MNSVIQVAVLAAALGRSSAQVASLASQTFFIPMPEKMIHDSTFTACNSANDAADGSVVTLIGVTVSTDGTQVFWDHWEDGYETDATNPTKATTEVWGDGNPNNGCVPKKPCTVEGDRLKAGDVVILENVVPYSRTANSPMKYDGGDRVQASYPVTITRAAYPNNPQTLAQMAGAIEVLDTTQYGTSFIAPVGEDVANPDPIESNPFEYVTIYILASQDGTVVTLPDSSTRTLKMGETALVNNVKVNNKVTASKPCVAQIITGDRNSVYELRWYSLLDVGLWDTNYLAPVGDTKGQVRLVVFNPGTSSLSISTSYLSNGTPTTKTVSVPAGKNAVTDVIPTGSAMSLTAASKFIALSVHEAITTCNSASDGGAGATYDWGYPVLGTSWLTSSLIVGLGYGCTSNDCGLNSAKTNPRNGVWITPVKDAWVHVDYNNDGVVDNSTQIKYLASAFYLDKDDDMSGARFFGTETNSISGVPVNIAGAWGQNADLSFSGDRDALDMGTVVLPLQNIRVTKSAKLFNDADKNGGVSPGDTLEYTIQVQNVGPGTDIVAGGYTLLDDQMPSGVTYVPGTFTAVSSQSGTMWTADDKTGTPFPLDGTGFVSKADLIRRGGTHDYKFQVLINAGADKLSPLVNRGVLKVPSRPDLPFSVSTPVVPQLIWNPPPPAPPTGSCMQDVYKYYGRPGTLACTAKQVWLEEVQASQVSQCIAGQPMNLTLNALVRFNGYTKYDAHWYVARDGGDALTGKCAPGMLDEKYAAATAITQSKTLNLVTGKVTWDGTGAIDTDECGDVTLSDTANGGVMNYNILLNTEVMCKDADKNGKLDISVCFGWKESATDTVCKVTDKLTAGLVPDLYPGATSTCFCAQYQIPNVVVMNPGGKTYPCT